MTEKNYKDIVSIDKSIYVITILLNVILSETQALANFGFTTSITNFNRNKQHINYNEVVFYLHDYVQMT